MPNLKESFRSYKDFVQLGIQILGGIIVLLNLWLVNKLSPIAENVTSLTTQVDAMEVTLDDLESNSIQVIRNADSITGVKEDIKDIRDSQLRFENYFFK